MKTMMKILEQTEILRQKIRMEILEQNETLNIINLWAR